jgi:hypothetical protein
VFPMRTTGKTMVVVIGVVVALAVPSLAVAQSPRQPPSQAAVDAYVEELPTATGAVAADSAATLGKTTLNSGVGVQASTGGRGGLLGLGIVLAAVAAGIVLVRVRSGDTHDSSA